MTGEDRDVFVAGTAAYLQGHQPLLFLFGFFRSSLLALGLAIVQRNKFSNVLPVPASLYLPAPRSRLRSLEKKHPLDRLLCIRKLA